MALALTRPQVQGLTRNHWANALPNLRNERETICRIIADNTGKKLEDVEQDMFTGITLTAEQAKDYGLVHEIKSQLFEKQAEVISIT